MPDEFSLGEWDLGSAASQGLLPLSWDRFAVARKGEFFHSLETNPNWDDESREGRKKAEREGRKQEPSLLDFLHLPPGVSENGKKPRFRVACHKIPPGACPHPAPDASGRPTLT
ncbi:hypothetical protein PtB15_2B247 [Puccinia triticina]|nr:hypothetical protein PtB15_2B247 [Puccinia triticina]